LINTDGNGQGSNLLAFVTRKTEDSAVASDDKK